MMQTHGLRKMRISQSQSHTTRRNNKIKKESMKRSWKEYTKPDSCFIEKEKRKDLQAPSNINRKKGYKLIKR